jgi:hypothetical protein
MGEDMAADMVLTLVADMVPTSAVDMVPAPVVDMAPMSVVGMVPTSAVEAPAIPRISCADMITTSGTAAGGIMASVRAGYGRMTTRSTCGFAFEDENAVRNKLSF